MLFRSVYAEDGTKKEVHPYTVTANTHRVQQLQPRGKHPHAVFLTTPKDSISYHYERNPEDPRVGQEITLKVDDYGNVTDKVSIGYPRRASEYPEQTTLQVIYDHADFIDPNKNPGNAEGKAYYVGVPCQQQRYEVPDMDWEWGASTKPFSAQNFEFLTDGKDARKTLLKWSKTYFKKDDFAGEFDKFREEPTRRLKQIGRASCRERV